MPTPVALPFTEMSDEGSVWDAGPQYPEMWPAPAEGTSAQDVPEDHTPQTGSPVDIDRPIPEPAPVVPTPTPPKKDRRPPGWWQGAVMGFPVWILFAFLAVVFVVFIIILRSGDPGTTSDDRVQTTEAVTTVPSQVIPPTTVAAATTTPTSPVPTTAPPVFTLPESPDTAPPTAAPTVAPTTPATEPPPTAPPATAPPAATVAPEGPVVTIIGRVGPCNFGAECLLAGFALHDFDSQPSEFVCEFADGSRYTFRFTRQVVERACARGDPNDSITIEVDGVRSATYRRP